MTEPLLRVEDLGVAYPPYGPGQHAVRGVSLTLHEGEALGIVGESGSGKTTLAFALLGHLGAGLRRMGGRVTFRGRDIAAMPEHERRRLLGRHIAHVAQDPGAALNPSRTVGAQLTEGMRVHLGLGRAEATARALKLLDEVRLPDGAAVLRAYPHHLSGGMQQRVCIAMALSCNPSLLILDEPTTGLDAVTEVGILDLLADLRRDHRMSAIMISHNLAAVAGFSDRVAIMYGGCMVETGATGRVFAEPRHRYTRLLLNAQPSLRHPGRAVSEIPWQETVPVTEGCPFIARCDLAADGCREPEAGRLRTVAPGRETACVRHEIAEGPARVVTPPTGPRATAPATAKEPVLAVDELVYRYRRGRLGRRDGERPAVDRLTFDLRPGEVLALVGESGSGKSTLARNLLGLRPPESGSIRFGGRDIAGLSSYPRSVTRRLQIVFQNIAGSLHPLKRLSDVLARPYRLYEGRRPSEAELGALVESVGLKRSLLGTVTRRLSGGERQRAALARAYAPKPQVIVLDEAFSALDVSMKARVSQLLLAKKNELGTSYLFITHDLPFAQHLADRIMVMYRGWLCEIGPARIVNSPPFHPYTEILVWSALALEGLSPRHLDLARADLSATSAGTGTGCRFHGRCPRAMGALCETEEPPLRAAGNGHLIACHHPVEDLAAMQTAEWPDRPPQSTPARQKEGNLR